MSKDLTVKQESSVAVVVEKDNRGFENVELESVRLPIARLLQPISKEVADDAFSDYNFKAGNVIHSLLLEKMPEKFIPLTMNSDKILFVPKQEAQKDKLRIAVKDRFGVDLTDEDMKSGYICRARDNQTGDKFGQCSNCKLCEFDGNTAPFCTKNINVLSVFEGQELPIVIRFANTSHKHGLAFKNLAFFASAGKYPLFAKQYKLVPVKKTDSATNNMWYELTVKPCGNAEGEAYAIAEELYNSFSGMMIDVDDDDHGVVSEPVKEQEY